MTWLAVWDLPHWPGHDYAEHATREEAEVFARGLGREVAVIPAEGARETPQGGTEGRAEVSVSGCPGMVVEGRKSAQNESRG
jgi:hypothetical protein